MKLSQLLLTTSLCAVVALPASAQPRTFASIDTDRDGNLSMKELTDAFGTAGAQSFLAYADRDGSGSVSVAEAQISQDDEDDEDDDEDDRDERDDDEDDRDGMSATEIRPCHHSFVEPRTQIAHACFPS